MTKEDAVKYLEALRMVQVYMMSFRMTRPSKMSRLDFTEGDENQNKYIEALDVAIEELERPETEEEPEIKEECFTCTFFDARINEDGDFTGCGNCRINNFICKGTDTCNYWKLNPFSNLPIIEIQTARHFHKYKKK